VTTSFQRVGAPGVILAAEDDPNDALLLKRTFAKAGLGHALVIVSDGQEAVDYIQGNPPFNDRLLCPQPVLLLVDVQMPRRTGLEVLEWLQRQSKEKQIPAFLFTSAISPDDLKRSLQLGARSCLIKPFDIADWVAVVQGLRNHLPPLLGTPRDTDPKLPLTH
jgi:CheY-like chemotaxis protein